LRAEAPQYALDGTRMRLCYRGESVDAVIPLIGEPAVGAALAAVGVALVCGMTLERAAERLALVEPPAGRLRPHLARSSAIVIDDTVGAEPSAMLAALRTLAILPAQRRIAVLGDLPADSAIPGEQNDTYATIGTLAARTADVLIWKGDAGTHVMRAVQRMRAGVSATVVHTIAGALEAMPPNLGAGDLVLVCGGATARLERLVAALIVHVEGLYTHFADADAADPGAAEAQLRRFCGALDAVTGAGLRPPVVHAANSAAMLRLPGARCDMVRPGIACYGLAPSPWVTLPAALRPALSFHSEVAQVRDLPPGTPVSYGGTFVTRRHSRIATIPVGYADGMRRAPPWREVLVRGRRAPVVGRICMDYAMIDVTDHADVRRGDLVTLIGAQGDACITVAEVASWLGTISYDVVATILPRVPREVSE